MIGPDWLGFLWVAGFMGLPLWIAAADRGLPASTWLLWPMASFGLLFLWVGWRSESFGLWLLPEGLVLRRGFGVIGLRYSQVVSVGPWRRDLPVWMRRLAPLIAGANPTAAGAIRLARPRRGLALDLADGGRVVIETDALQPGPERILAALRQGKASITGADLPDAKAARAGRSGRADAAPAERRTKADQK